MIKVAIAGPRGKMGREAVHTILQESEMELVAVLDRHVQGTYLNEYELFPTLPAIPVFESLQKLFDSTKPEVFIDLTGPTAVYDHLMICFDNHVHPVIGTTGLTPRELELCKNRASELKLGGIIAPNFAIGAILMMKFAQQAAKYFSDVEILEYHHDQKLDAPSGTALKTAELIRENREPHTQGRIDEKELLEGARGASLDGIRIHSVRLPGYVAHQEVQFGAEGERLTIRHDSMDRKSFMNGIVYSVRKSCELNELVYGLENII